MRVVLLKDIVILRGTIFDTAPTNTRRFGPGHVEAVFGLSKDSYGTVSYCLADEKEDALRDWFAPVQETASRKKSKAAGKTSNNSRSTKARLDK